MANQLPAEVVRAVVRDWLCAKDDLISKLLCSIADRLAPIAAEQAGLCLLACLDPDPREEVILHLERGLVHAIKVIDWIEGDAGSPAWQELALNELDELRNQFQGYLRFSAQRKSVIPMKLPAAAPAPAVKEVPR